MSINEKVLIVVLATILGVSFAVNKVFACGDVVVVQEECGPEDDLTGC